MSSVEGADADREGEVEGALAWKQREVLCGDAASTEQSGVDLVGGVVFDQSDSFGGTVDHEDVAVADPARDGFGCRSGRSAYFQDAHAGS
ncbi:MAG: hypothetical protein KIS78_00080 [Labilithrix sp.]|nr:hypothetical protein [Labilithrix sp.]